MSYNSNSSSSESNNKMEINSNNSNNSSGANNPKTSSANVEMTSGNSNNNVSMESVSTSSCSKLTGTSPSISTKTSSSSLCNSNKSSSSSDENNRKNKPEICIDNNKNINSFSSNDDDDDDADEVNTQYNSSNQSDEYRNDTGGSRSAGGCSGSGNGENTSDSIRNQNDNIDAVPHTVSAYERLTKSVRSFLNATRILRSQFTNASPESSANEESSSNNQSSSLSPFSSTSSASPPSSSSSSQSGLSPPSISSSNQSSSSSNMHRMHHHHFHHHHHHTSSSSNSDKVKNMTKKSNLFDELLKHCSDNTVSCSSSAYTLSSSAKKPSQKVSKTNLKNLITLFKNNENYYSTMFFPITDNFKLESSKTRYTFRNSNTGRSSRHSSKKEIEIKSNGEDSNDFNEVEFAYKQQQAQQAAVSANNNNNSNNNNNNTSNTDNSNNNNNNNSNSNDCATSSTNTSNTNTNSDNVSPTSSTSTNNSNSNNTSNNNSSNNNTSPTTSTTSNSTTKSNVKYKSLEFFTCPICSHCLYEPITLICGCTFCKSCLNEFNLTSIKLSLIKLAKKNAAENLNELNLLQHCDTKKPCNITPNEGTSSKGACQSDDENSSVSSADDNNSNNSNSNNTNSNSDSSFKGLSCRSLGLFKCFNCSRNHQYNTAEYLKSNTNIANVVEKLFQSKIEIRKLRNDIRRFIVLNLESNNNVNNKTRHFDVNKYEKMFLYAYNLDKTNHLILADLFLINYFSGHLDIALEYAKKAAELRPKWAFAYFMKSIYYQKIGDLYNLRANLIQSFQLDSSIEQLRYKIFQINYIILKPNHSQITDNKSALAYLKSKDMLAKKSADISGIIKKSIAMKRSFSFNNNPEVNINEAASIQSKYPKVQSNVSFKKRFHSSENESKSFNSSTNLNYEFKSTESINTDENENGEANEDSKQIKVNPNLISTSDLECSLCYRLFYNPVTTPCGHSYCCSCLERSLDYQDKCPLCKNSLAEVAVHYLAERRQCPTLFLDLLIKNYFSKEYESRKKQYLDELKELTNNENEIPVFVCTTALPFASCPLHIYEPRYRLMLRRAIETGSRQFGMCMYSEMTPYHYTEYGCMLEIRNYQFTRDGRAVVATVGGRRFKVIRAYMKDGYNVAQIEWVTDVRETNEEDILELQTLHDKTYQLALKWYRLIPEIQKQKILEIYGDMPAPEADIQSNDNGPVWHWFLLNILPLENDFQYKFLTKTSLKERLKQIKKLLIFMLLIDRSRQQVTSSTSSQNIFSLQEGDVDSSQTTSANFLNTNRSRSSDGIESNTQVNNAEDERDQDQNV